MTLEQFLRGKLSTLFIPLVKGEKCEICNSKYKLYLHHIKPFAIMLEEALADLNLQYHKDKNSYTDIEIKNVANIMLGKHLDSCYLTLCNDCHSHLHKVKDGSLSNITTKHEEYYAKEKLKNKLIEKYKIKCTREIMKPYLDSITDKKLFEDEQEELIKIFKKNKLKARTMGINTLNNFLKNINIPYTIKSKRENRRKSKNYKRTYWIVQKSLIK